MVLTTPALVFRDMEVEVKAVAESAADLRNCRLRILLLLRAVASKTIIGGQGVPQQQGAEGTLPSSNKRRILDEVVKGPRNPELNGSQHHHRHPCHSLIEDRIEALFGQVGSSIIHPIARSVSG